MSEHASDADSDDSAAGLAARLIRCRSVTPEDGGALDALEAMLGPHGFSCQRMAFSGDNTPDVDNLFARFGDGHPHFCFAGHTDVVPAGDEAAWSAGPFSAEIRNGELFGRGAVDMKGAVACFVRAARDHIEARDGKVSGSISLLITGDEEGPAINGTAKMLDRLKDMAATPDHCLLGEPTNPDTLGEQIKIGRRGSLNGRVTVHGVQGHVAYPRLAANAAARLVRILARLVDLRLDDGTEHFEPSNLQITSIDVGNGAVNVIPARAEARFNVRFNDAHSRGGLEGLIEEQCRQATVNFKGSYELEFASSGGGAFMTAPGDFTDLVAKAVEAETGKRPALTTGGGTSDARFIKDHCPVVEFGLVGKTMHQVDERVEIADLDRLTRVYRAVLDAYFIRFARP